MADEIDVIDYGMWYVPSKWDDIDLGTYQDLERFYEGKDEKFDIRKVIHILCHKTEDEVNSLPIDFLENIMEKLIFLQEKPTEEEPSNKITINGETYMINFMEKLKTGEFISADTVLKNDRHNYAALLAILCRKEGEVYDSKFEAEVFDDRVKMWEEQPVVNVLKLVSFFLQLYIQSETPSKLYMMVEEALDRTQQSIETSQKLGGWKRLFLRWQITRLRKSLGSSKNISQTSSHFLPTLFRKGKWKKRKTNGKKRGAKR